MDPRESCRQISPGAKLEAPVSRAQGCPRENQDPPRNKARSWIRRPIPPGIWNAAKSPPEKTAQRRTKEAGSRSKNPGDFSSGKLGESKTAFTGDAKSCFSSLSELPLVQAPASTYTPRSSTCGWCPASSRTLSAAFIGGEARLVSVATQILAASPRSPPPRSRPRTRREKCLKGAGDSWRDG